MINPIKVVGIGGGIVELSQQQRERYERNIVISGIGEQGQEKLLKARVLVVGSGGLGSPVVLYLAAAGIGTLGIVDDDIVSLSNLGRQVIHETDDVGRGKIRSAADKVGRLNRDVNVEEHVIRLTPENALQIVTRYDVIVDAVDNFGARYLLSDACIIAKKPFVHGAVMGLDGEISVMCAQAPCYRCLFPRAPQPGTVPTPEQKGVLSPVPGVIGTLQAVEVIKLITGIGKSLQGRLLMYDGMRAHWHEVQINKSDRCLCSGEVFIDPSNPMYRY